MNLILHSLESGQLEGSMRLQAFNIISTYWYIMYCHEVYTSKTKGTCILNRSSERISSRLSSTLMGNLPM